MSSARGGGWDSEARFDKKKSKSGRSHSTSRRKSQTQGAKGVAAGPQASGPKHELLKKDLTNRVLYGADLHDSEISDEVSAFVTDSVRHLMRTGSTGSTNVQRVSQLAKAMHEGERRNKKPPVSPPLPQGKALPSHTGGNAWMSPPSGNNENEQSPRSLSSKKNVSVMNPPSYNPPGQQKMIPRPPSEGEEHRPTVAARFNRLNQDKKWAKHVDEEAAKFKVEQQMVVDRRKLLQVEQNEILRSQMEEAQKRKQEEKVVQRRDMQSYLEAQKIKDEEAKKREIEIKVTTKQQRKEIEVLMREKVKEQELVARQQKDAERVYVNQIIAEEKERKALERQKKAQNRQDLLNHLEENFENEQIARKHMETQRHKDRRDTVARQEMMLEKEDLEKQALMRKDEKGRRLMERSEKMQAAYDAKKQLQDALNLEAEQRMAEDAKRRAEKEMEREAERIRVKDQHKAKAVRDLEQQMYEKQLQKEAVAEKDAAYRARVAEAIKLGTASDSLIKQKEAERKLIMMRTLETQIKDKQRRARSLGVPHKVGHEY